MATSGSIDFSVTRDQIISLALQQMGVMQATDTTSSGSFTDNSTSLALLLNMLVKQWAGDNDTANGLRIWDRQRAYLIMQQNQNSYSLGPVASGGDHWVSSYNQTTTTQAQASGDSTITVASTTGFANAVNVGITRTDGSIKWLTESGAPSGSTITLSSTLGGAVASGAVVFVHTVAAQAFRPLKILDDILVRDTSNNDVPIGQYRTLEEYLDIASKTQTTQPSMVYYEPQLINGVLYIDGYPQDVTKVLACVSLTPTQDFDSSTDNPDYPQPWYLPLMFGLCVLGAPMFGKQAMIPTFKLLRDEAYEIAQNLDAEVSDAYYQSHDAPSAVIY